MEANGCYSTSTSSMNPTPAKLLLVYEFDVSPPPIVSHFRLSVFVGSQVFS